MILGFFINMSALYEHCRETLRISHPLVCSSWAEQEYININNLHEIRIAVLVIVTAIITYSLNRKMSRRQILSSIQIGGIGFIGLVVFCSIYFGFTVLVIYYAIPFVLAALGGGGAAKYLNKPNKSLNQTGADNAPPG